jgi:hypothetical protein
MRKFLALSCCALTLALAGCAGDGGSRTVKSGFDDDADYVKMTQINRDALLRGYRIVWVHAPQKEAPRPPVPTGG